MKRIQRFISTDEVQTNIVEFKDDLEQTNAIQVNGNFSWGLRDKGKDEENEKEEDKSKDEKN
jgi:hypothetical protein